MIIDIIEHLTTLFDQLLDLKEGVVFVCIFDRRKKSDK